MMSTQRIIEFEAISDDAAERVARALRAAFAALTEAKPKGVRLAYWRAGGGRRFKALVELADEKSDGDGDDPSPAAPGARWPLLAGPYGTLALSFDGGDRELA